jgi:hypothetical protein
MLRAAKILSLLVVLASAPSVIAQSVGRISSAPLNFAPVSDSYSRTSRPAPAAQIDGVVRASYYQNSPSRGPAPSERVASNRGANYSSSGAIPIQSLPPAQRVPLYYPMSYSTQTRSYGAQPGCGPMGVPTYPISAAPTPYAAPPQAAPGARPFLPLARMPNQVYVSRGLIGQPIVYVPGQPLRNGLRYILP